jgi:hypothetical protein
MHAHAAGLDSLDDPRTISVEDGEMPVRRGQQPAKPTRVLYAVTGHGWALALTGRA